MEVNPGNQCHIMRLNMPPMLNVDVLNLCNSIREKCPHSGGEESIHATKTVEFVQVVTFFILNFVF